MKTKPVVVLVLLGICLGFATYDSTPAYGWNTAKWLAILFSALFGLLIDFFVGILASAHHHHMQPPSGPSISF